MQTKHAAAGTAYMLIYWLVLAKRVLPTQAYTPLLHNIYLYIMVGRISRFHRTTLYLNMVMVSNTDIILQHTAMIAIV